MHSYALDRIDFIWLSQRGPAFRDDCHVAVYISKRGQIDSRGLILVNTSLKVPSRSMILSRGKAHRRWDGSPAAVPGCGRDAGDSPVRGDFASRGMRDAGVSPHPLVPVNAGGWHDGKGRLFTRRGKAMLEGRPAGGLVVVDAACAA